MLPILNVYNVSKVGDFENKANLEMAGLGFSLLSYLNASVINPSLTPRKTLSERLHLL